MDRKNLTFLALTCLLVTAGVTAGHYFAQPELGIVTGVLLSALTIIILRPTAPRQWLLPGVAAVILVLSSLVDYPRGLISALVVIIFALWLGSLSARPLYGNSLEQAVEATLRLISGQPINTQVIMEPSKLVEIVSSEQLGPLRLVVKPYAAVILVNGSSQTRIVGPQTLNTQPREYVSRVYSLSRKRHVYTFEKVLTNDLMTTEVKLGISYQLAVSPQAQIGAQPLSDPDTDALRRFQPLATNWTEELNQLVEASVREFIGQRTLNTSLETANWGLICNQLHARLRGILQRWGVFLIRVDLVSIQPDQHVSRARRERWLADTNADTIVRYEAARAQAWGEALQILGEAYEDAEANNVPRPVILRELLRRILDQAATDVSTKGLVPPRLSRLLAELDDPNDNPPRSP